MNKFAFITHPIEVKRDVAKKYPIAQYLPVSLIEAYIKGKDPITIAKYAGIHSLIGDEIEGWLIACPLTPRQLTTLPVDFVVDKLEKCGRIALELGARVMGLGAFTSVAGDGGITLAKRLPGLAITTGNSYTVRTAVEGAVQGGAMMGHKLSESKVAVVGANGSIGATCAELLAREVAEVMLVGRNLERLNNLAEKLTPISRAKIRVSADITTGLKQADIVITVTSAVDAVIQPEYIKCGAVVCDVSRPRDVSIRVAKERNDVLVIEGGIVKVPGAMTLSKIEKPDQSFSFGFPPGTAYACMSETMMLALESRWENFTLGKEVSVAQADEMGRLALKHGFHLDGFRAFETAVTEEAIDKIRTNAFGSERKSLYSVQVKATAGKMKLSVPD